MFTNKNNIIKYSIIIVTRNNIIAIIIKNRLSQYDNDSFTAPPRFYKYTDEKITQILSSRYLSQEVRLVI